VTAFLWLHWRFIENIAIRIALRSLLSPGKQDEINELTKRFDRFKQQFDRGISVQSVGTLEMLLEVIGMILHLPFKANY
jgi:hypothetical protein